MTGILPGKILVKFQERLHSKVALPAGITNGGLIKMERGYLCVVRNCTWCYPWHLGIAPRTPQKPVRGYLYAIFLDSKFTIQRAVLLSVDGSSEGVVFEDARLFWWRDNIHALIMVSKKAGKCRSYDQYLGVVDCDRGRVIRLPMPHRFPLPQKNWNPIVYGDKLYLDYWHNPRIILEYDKTDVQAAFVHEIRDLGRFSGDYIRGSAPPIPAPNGHLLASYHTCPPKIRGNPDREYLTIFAYLDPHPPFQAVAYTGEMKLLDKGPSQQVQFLMGAAAIDHDPKRLVLSFGVADYDNIIASVKWADIDAQMQ